PALPAGSCDRHPAAGGGEEAAAGELERRDRRREPERPERPAVARPPDGHEPGLAARREQPSVRAPRRARQRPDARQPRQPRPAGVVEPERPVAAGDEQPLAGRREARGDDAAAGPDHALLAHREQGRAEDGLGIRAGSELRGAKRQREALRRIGRKARERLRRELAPVGPARLRAGLAALDEREDRNRGDDEERGERSRREPEQPAPLPARPLALAPELEAAAPGEERCREHVVEDLVARLTASGAVDAPDEAVVRERREQLPELGAREVGVGGEVVERVRDLRPGGRHELADQARGHALPLDRQRLERAVDVLAHDRLRAAQPAQRPEAQPPRAARPFGRPQPLEDELEERRLDPFGGLDELAVAAEVDPSDADLVQDGVDEPRLGVVAVERERADDGFTRRPAIEPVEPEEVPEQIRYAAREGV